MSLAEVRRRAAAGDVRFAGVLRRYEIESEQALRNRERRALPPNPTLESSKPMRSPETVSQTAGEAISVKPGRAISMNATERELQTILKVKFPKAIIRWEAYTLRLAQRCTYCPDFSVMDESGKISFWECKGSYVFPKALVKLRLAAELFEHRFTLAQKLKTGWVFTEIPRRVP